MSKSKKTGDLGESIAASFLEICGYTCLAKQYRKQTGEIDLIVRRDDDIVFVEVKTRGADSLAPPEYWVDERKQEHLRATAQYWMFETDLKGACNFRFDVVAIQFFGPNQGMKIHHLAGIM